jgi:protein ImuB
MPPVSPPAPAVGIRPLWIHEPYFLGEGAELPADLKLISGPERIESGWWQGTAIKRDYFVAADHHRLCWIYREQRGVMQWYRHGWFS